MRFVGLLIISFLLSFSALAQKFVFDGQVTDFDTKKRLGGVTVAAFSDGKEVLKMTTGNNGKYSMELPIDKDYQIRYTKSGYVIKTMRVNAVGILEEDLPIGGQIMPAVDIELFAERPGVDFSFMKTEPVVVWEYNKRKLIMDWDKKVVSQMKDKIDALLKEAEEKIIKYDAEYNALIKEANTLYRDEKYDQALEKYIAATKIPGKERESHPNARILEIDDLLAQKEREELLSKQADQAYQNLIDAAENLKSKGDLEAAIVRFREASDKKPSEQYPKDQIKALQEEINATKLKGKYDELIKAADGLFASDKLEEAKKKYDEASKILPSESHPKDQIKTIEERLKLEKEALAKKKKYDDAIAQADKFFQENKYPVAIAKYKEAQEVDKENEYPTKQIALAEQKQKEQQEAQQLEQRYQASIKAGDEAFKAKQFEKAIAAYNEASKAKEGESYPKDQIKKIEEIKAEEAALAEQQQKIEQLLKDASKNHNDGDYKDALDKFQEVLKIDPANAKAKTGKQEAEKALATIAEVAAQQEKFDGLVKEADALFAGDKLNEAKDKYQAAEKVIPNNPHVTDQLNKIKGKLEEQKANEALAQQIQGLLNQAKQTEEKEKLDEAEKKYNEVIALDSKNDEALKGLSRIETKRKEIAEKEKAAAVAAESEKALKEELLATAKTAEEQQDWDKAIETYNEILAKDKDNVAVKTKLKQVETAKKQAEEAQREATYKELISEADALVDKGEFDAAEQKYKEAKKVKPSSEVDRKINEVQQKAAKLASAADKEEKVNALLQQADELFAKENFPKALEAYEKVRVFDEENEHAKERIKVINKKFIASFDKGTELLSAKDYAGAIKAFDDALEINPLSEAVQQKRKFAKDELDKLMAKEERYAKLMEEAKNKLKNEDLTGAKKIFQEAQVLKPQESEPQVEIVKIDEALRKKQEDQASLQKEVATLIKDADELAKKGEFDQAIAKIEQADALSPDPTNQKKIEKIQKKQEERKKDEAFEELVEAAKKAFADGDLETSKSRYEEAAKIKEDPAVRASLKKIKEEMDKPEEVVEVDNTQELLNQANQAYLTKDYETAKKMYEQVQKEDPTERTSLNRIKEIEATLAAAEAERQEIEQKQTRMDKAIAAGDKKKEKGDFLGAKDEYEKALALDPSNVTLRQKVAEAVEAAQRKADVKIEEQYQKIITKADEYFDSESYERSKKLYERALTFRNYDQHAKDRIDEINRRLREPVKKDVNLEYLGEDEELSVLEAAALLEQAERKRQELQSQRVIDKQLTVDEKSQELSEADALSRRLFQEEIERIEKERTRKYLEDNIARGQQLAVSLDDEIKAIEERRLQEQAFERGAVIRQNEALRFMMDDFVQTQQEADGKHLVLADEIRTIQEEDLKQLQVRNNSLNEQRKRNTAYMERLQDDLSSDTERAKLRRDDNQEKLRLIAEEQELPHSSSEKHLSNAGEIDRLQQEELTAQAQRELASQDQRKLNTAYMERLQDDLSADTERAKLRRDDNQEKLRLIAEEQEQPHRSSEKHLSNADELDGIQLKALEAQQERDAKFEAERKERTAQMEQLTDDIAADRTKTQDRVADNLQQVTRIQELQEVPHESSEKHLANASDLNDIQLKAMEMQLDRDADAKKDSKKATQYMDNLKDEIQSDTERAKIRRDDNQERLRLIAEEQEIPHSSSSKHLDNANEIDGIKETQLTSLAARELEAQEQRKQNTAYMEELQQELQADVSRAKDRRDFNQEQLRIIAEEQEQPHSSSEKHLANADELDQIQLRGLEMQQERELAVSEQRKSTTAYMGQLTDDLREDRSRATDKIAFNDEFVREQLAYQEQQLALDAEDSYNKLQNIQYQATQAELKKAEINEQKRIVQQQIEDDLRFLIAQSDQNQFEETIEKQADLIKADKALVAAQDRHKATTEFKDVGREKTVAEVEDITKRSEIERRQAIAANKQKVQDNADRVQDIQRMNEEQLLAMDEDLTALRDLLQDQVVALEDKVRARDEQKVQQRQTVVTDIERTKIEAETERTEKQAVAKDNHSVIDAVTAIKDSEEAQRKEALRAQKLRRQELLDGLDSGKIRFSEAIANSLGDEFPEGVSQETFVKNDKDGLPIQVITRRIVVVDGKGDVYLRMQSKRGITYSKNGQPVSEQAWLKGTESGKLQRHF